MIFFSKMILHVPAPFGDQKSFVATHCGDQNLLIATKWGMSHVFGKP
jgi:hypothetical protein